jgi:DNA-binding CsgD family transcriptional regulator
MIEIPETRIIDFKNHPNSILEVWYKQPVPEFTYPIAHLAVEERKAAQAEKFCHVLVHAEQEINVTPDAWEYLCGPEGLTGIASAALVYSPDTKETVEKFVASFDKAPILIKAFGNREDAFHWSVLQSSKPVPDRLGTEPPQTLEAVRTDVAEAVQNNSDPAEKAIMGLGLRAMQRPELTPMQAKVLRHIVDGMSSKDIARKMGKAKKTIDHHRGTLLQILHVNNTAELIAVATKLGLVRI